MLECNGFANCLQCVDWQRVAEHMEANQLQ